MMMMMLMMMIASEKNYWYVGRILQMQDLQEQAFKKYTIGAKSLWVAKGKKGVGFSVTETYISKPKGIRVECAMICQKEEDTVDQMPFIIDAKQNIEAKAYRQSGYRVVKKKVSLDIFSIIRTNYNKEFLTVKITDKVLSLSKFWRHLVNVKIVKIRHSNGHISYIKQCQKNIFL